MPKGGKRPGSGPKPRSTGLSNRQMREQLIKFALEEANMEMFFAKLKEKLLAGNERVLTWYGDQVMGKAIQTVEMGDETRKLIVID